MVFFTIPTIRKNKKYLLSPDNHFWRPAQWVWFQYGCSASSQAAISTIVAFEIISKTSRRPCQGESCSRCHSAATRLDAKVSDVVEVSSFEVKKPS